MRRNRGWQCLGPVFAVFIPGGFLASAHADPITIPGFTVTDLGAGTPTFSTDGNGNGVLNAPNGQVFAFSQTSNSPLSQGMAATIPLLQSAPVNNPLTFGNPANAFAYVQSAVMNANGLVAVTEASGVAGHIEDSSAYAVQLNANGSWGNPLALWTGNPQVGTYSPQMLITGVNNLNQILGSMGLNAPSYNQSDAVIYSMTSHTLVNLNNLFLNSASGGIYQSGGDYALNQPIALDNLGRIVLSATEFNPTVGLTQTNLLLTPDGLSAAPREVPAPEPGALAIGLLAIAGLACRRLRERRRAA